MNEDFVSFSLAKKLKEKGFYYKCISTYDNDGMLGYNYIQPTSIRAIGFDDCLCSHNVENDGCIDAPTISQVLKWLREDKKIFLCVDISEKGWYYATCPIITKDGKEISRDFDVYNKEFYDYNSAAIAGVEYIIDNLI